MLLRGSQVFRGYWDGERAEVTPALLPDDWFPTGDLGALDEDGYLTITGRKKDIIITSGGKNVTPAPLEDWLRAHPLVSQCMVVGDNRSFVTALITLEPDGLQHWRRMTKKQDIPMRTWSTTRTCARRSRRRSTRRTAWSPARSRSVSSRSCRWTSRRRRAT